MLCTLFDDERAKTLLEETLGGMNVQVQDLSDALYYFPHMPLARCSAVCSSLSPRSATK